MFVVAGEDFDGDVVLAGEKQAFADFGGEKQLFFAFGKVKNFAEFVNGGGGLFHQNLKR